MKSYHGLAYRQALDPKSPWIVSFVAPAEDLLRWVGIPRRSEKGLVGFQRLDEEARVLRAKEFFKKPQNQSPTALIVGLHKPASEPERLVTLDFTGGEANGIRPCVLNINFDPATLTDDQIRNFIKRQIEARLADTPTNDEAEAQDEIIAEDDEDSEDGEVIEGADDAENGALELGRSLLYDLRAKLDDDVWFSANREALLDLAKPATLIDGQHRIKGAELCERKIPFAVCALYDCSWSEQVFQFTVVNYTQKGIPDQFITANAALSLTSFELNQLEDRLVQAQVKVIEYELMRIINFDQESPFYDLINLTARSEAEKIGYKTMVRVAKTWYSGRHDAVRLIINNIYPHILGKKSEVAKRRLEQWQSGDWGHFFIAFWAEVYKRYATTPSHQVGHFLWEVGHSNLMIAVVLLELQEHFLANLGAQDDEYFQPKTAEPLKELRAKVSDRAEKFLEWFPADLFARKWKTTSLNTGAGRAALQDCFGNLVKKKGSFKYANSTLVTGKMDGAG